MEILCKKFALLGEKIWYHRKWQQVCAEPERLTHIEMAERYQAEADIVKSDIERYADLTAKTAKQALDDDQYLYTVWEERIM